MAGSDTSREGRDKKKNKNGVIRAEDFLFRSSRSLTLKPTCIALKPTSTHLVWILYFTWLPSHIDFTIFLSKFYYIEMVSLGWSVVLGGKLLLLFLHLTRLKKSSTAIESISNSYPVTFEVLKKCSCDVSEIGVVFCGFFTSFLGWLLYSKLASMVKFFFFRPCCQYSDERNRSRRRFSSSASFSRRYVWYDATGFSDNFFLPSEFNEWTTSMWGKSYGASDRKRFSYSPNDFLNIYVIDVSSLMRFLKLIQAVFYFSLSGIILNESFFIVILLLNGC